MGWRKKISSHEIKIHFLALRPGSEYFSKELKLQKSNGIENEISIHKGQPHNTFDEKLKKDIMGQLSEFQAEMCSLGYQWVPNVAFWKKFNDGNYVASPDEKFFSTSIMRYGVGWRK